MILFNDKNDSKKEGRFGINAHCSPQEKAFLFIFARNLAYPQNDLSHLFNTNNIHVYCDFYYLGVIKKIL